MAGPPPRAEIPEDLRASWDGQARVPTYAAWCDLKVRYAEAYPEENAAFEAALRPVPEAVLSALTAFAEAAQAEGKALVRGKAQRRRWTSSLRDFPPFSGARPICLAPTAAASTAPGAQR